MSIMVPLGGFEKCVCVSRVLGINYREEYHAFESNEMIEASRSMESASKHHTLVCRRPQPLVLTESSIDERISEGLHRQHMGS